QLDLGERLALRAWLHGQRGDPRAESLALERWLQVEPAATRAMGRLAELAHQAGDAGRVVELRRRQAEVERAVEGYRLRLWHGELPRSAAERSELAHLAEATGHRHEARALYAWALKADPLNPSAQEGLTRLDRRDAERQLALAADTEPWPEPAPIIRRGRA